MLTKIKLTLGIYTFTPAEIHQSPLVWPVSPSIWGIRPSVDVCGKE